MKVKHFGDAVSLEWDVLENKHKGIIVFPVFFQERKQKDFLKVRHTEGAQHTTNVFLGKHF